MFSHSGVVSQSECIHNWSMWPTGTSRVETVVILNQSEAPPLIYSHSQGPSVRVSLHIWKFSPTRCALHWLDGIYFWGTVLNKNRVSLSSYIHNLTSRLVGNFRETVSCLPIWYVPIYKWDLYWDRWIMICQEEGSADYLFIHLFFVLSICALFHVFM